MMDCSRIIDVSTKAAGALAITVSIVAAAGVAAAPANADATSDAFLSALNNSGVSYNDPNTAVSMAQSVCPMLAQPGGDFAGVVSQMGGNNGLSPGMASFFTSIAISMYCPNMMASIANGSWFGQSGQSGIPGMSGLTGIPGLSGIPGI